MIRYNIIIPRNLKDRIDFSLEHFPPNFDYKPDYFYSIVYDIMKGNKYSNSSGTALSSKYLRKLYGALYARYNEYLRDYSVISIDKHYSTNNCRKYYINNTNVIDDFNSYVKVEIPRESNVFRALNEDRKREIKKSKNNKSRNHHPHIELMRQRFMSIKFDYDAALNDLIGNAHLFSGNQRLQYLTSLFEFSHERRSFRYFVRDEKNFRVNSNLTSLKSGFKKYIDTELELYQIDLCNSQPYLLNIILQYILGNKSNVLVPLCFLRKPLDNVLGLIITEVQKDSKLVSALHVETTRLLANTADGKWYEHLSDIYNNHYETTVFTRAHSKSLWMSIAYSSNKASVLRNHKKAFEREYPAVSKVIRMLKRGEHNKLSIGLQQLEANLFIDCIVSKLVELDIIPLTIHDCLIVEEHKVSSAEQIASEVLGHYTGAKPTFKKTRLKDIQLSTKVDLREEVGALIKCLENSRHEVADQRITV